MAARRSILPEANKAELACLAVNPDYRREGYGERLMKAVERAAKEHGINTLFVLTTRTAAWFTERGSGGRRSPICRKEAGAL